MNIFEKIELFRRERVYRLGTQKQVTEQCTADWVNVALSKRNGVHDKVIVRAGNVCWNEAARAAWPDVGQVEARLGAATGKRAVVDSSVDGWDGYVAVRFN
jgi:hypothetical protein